MAYNTKHTAEQIDALLGEVFDSTLQEKTIEITQSGTTEIVADADFLALKKVNLNVNVQGGGGSVEYLDVSGLDDDIKLELSLLCCIAKSKSGNSWYITSPLAYYLYNAKPVALGFNTAEALYLEGVVGTAFEFFEMMGIKELIDSLPRLTKEEFYAL